MRTLYKLPRAAALQVLRMSASLAPLVTAVIVGGLWGATNPLIRRGSIAVEAASPELGWRAWLSPALLLPYIANQAGSLLFVALLAVAGSRVSRAAPTANAVAVVANAVADLVLGERYQLAVLLPGCALVAAGVAVATL